jgi:hypothetical protein
MNRLNNRGNIGSSKNAIGCPMGRMDQLSNACEGDEKLCLQTFGMGVAILVNGLLKPYYREFVSPRFLKI